ncbi:YvzF family protein [Metabacillus sp. KIGAM252]|uniref:YvzF family protein n=1 Tax=Metabacillus flavus TaxID=2823519 RepID=A0ABS5LI89_9BACI|nr:YvzF family protein [Metabacillus flavus]
MAQIRIMGNKEELDAIIQSFEKNYTVTYTSKEYGRTNPKYKYSKDQRIYLDLKLKSQPLGE